MNSEKSFLQLDPEMLKARTEENLRAMTSPEFLAQLEAIRNVSREQRLDEAAKRLTPDALRKAGVPLPEGARVSSRYFEEGENFTLELGDTDDGRIPIAPALSKLQPGLLEKIRTQNPQLFHQISSAPVFGNRTQRSYPKRQRKKHTPNHNKGYEHSG